MAAFTYLLECADGSYYVGSTRDLDARVQQHEAGRVASTARRRPVQLVWSADYDTVDEAWAMERRLHGWSHAKKHALAVGDWSFLEGYSARTRASRVAVMGVDQ